MTEKTSDSTKHDPKSSTTIDLKELVEQQLKKNDELMRRLSD